MQKEEISDSVRSELLERLRAMESQQSTGPLSDLAYQRAREALERALEEAQSIRLQAIEDARSTREGELTALMQTMRSLRESAESQIGVSLRSAEIKVSRLNDLAKTEAESIIERASADAAQIKTDAAAVRNSAEERVHEIERQEAEFNNVISKLVKRLGINEKPSRGWFGKAGGKSN